MGFLPRIRANLWNFYFSSLKEGCGTSLAFDGSLFGLLGFPEFETP